MGPCRQPTATPLSDSGSRRLRDGAAHAVGVRCSRRDPEDKETPTPDQRLGAQRMLRVKKA